MPETLRTFVAVPVACPPSLRKVLQELQSLGGCVHTVNAEQLHLTLKFLGDIPWNRAPQVSREIQKIVAGHQAFAGQLRSLGVFPDFARPRVVWAGFTPGEPLSLIADELNESLGDLGFPREQRRFVPHVTLARVKRRPDARLPQFITRWAEAEFGGSDVDRLVFYQSELVRNGAKHLALSEHALQ